MAHPKQKPTAPSPMPCQTDFHRWSLEQAKPVPAGRLADHPRGNIAERGETTSRFLAADADELVADSSARAGREAAAKPLGQLRDDELLPS